MGSVPFDRTVEWLEGLHRRPHVLAETAGLRRAQFLLAHLGNPHRAFRSVHVAGTTGKGSTTSMIGSVLQAAGNRTGFFRSPHLETYRERIAVDDVMIDERSWIRCFNDVVEVAEAMERNSFPGYDLGRPTVFEVLFAMAALHFRDAGVTWAAVETGMGGRLDATNTLQSEVAVVTNISLEHTRILGDTVEEIAGEKAAIIKPHCDAVTAVRDAGALAVISARAATQGVRLRRLDRDFFVETHRRDLDGLEVTLSDERGALDIHLHVAGDFQALNVATAFGAARALQERGVALADREVQRGLEEVRIPGRFEILPSSPLVVLDGGHNPAAMKELGASLRSHFPDRRIVLLFAALRDKDVASMVRGIGEAVDMVVLTTAPNSDRAIEAGALARYFTKADKNILVREEPTDALNVALAATRSEDVLVVAGSLYLVGWARARVVTAGVPT